MHTLLFHYFMTALMHAISPPMSGKCYVLNFWIIIIPATSFNESLFDSFLNFRIHVYNNEDVTNFSMALSQFSLGVIGAVSIFSLRHDSFIWKDTFSLFVGWKSPLKYLY
ncbi:hypothetical protein RYX36_014639 [Vicia faba]